LATIVGGIAASHTPAIAYAFDTQKPDNPIWAPIFEAFAPVRAWLEEKAPDVLFFVYNDHVTSFFFDHYSNFALGFGEAFPVADEGGGPRPLPAIKGHPALAQHIAAGVVADQFDLSFFQAKGLDHGVFSPLSIMLPHEHGWPVAMVPLQVGVLEFPIPTARRCFALGRSLRKAILSYPEDIKVAVVDGALRFQGIPRGGFPTRDAPPGPKGPPATVAFYADDAVVATDGPFRGATGRFVRRDGAIVALRWGGRVHPREP